MTGCASPELGAHALLKFLNPSGYELGSAVVSLSHLLHTSTEEVHATQFANVSNNLCNGVCGVRCVCLRGRSLALVIVSISEVAKMTNA